MNSYYDLDAILAEDELIPITNLFDFQYLAHLDPDYIPPTKSRKSKRRIVSPSSTTTTTNAKSKSNVMLLPKLTRIQMPLWSIGKWSSLGFVRVKMPRMFDRRFREKLDHDALSINIRKKSERFYIAGMLFIDLIQKCLQSIQSQNLNDNTNNNNTTTTTPRQRRRDLLKNSNNHLKNNPQYKDLLKLHTETKSLKQTLLQTYTGPRLLQTFDWTLSHVEDDVSEYTRRLTIMECRLFDKAASASCAREGWKLNGSRRICVSDAALRIENLKHHVISSVSGGRDDDDADVRGKKRCVRTVTPDGFQSKRVKAF